MSSRAYFEIMIDVVCECLGEDHPCAQLFIEARSNLIDEITINKAFAAVNGLPKDDRDHILITTKARMKSESRFSKWLEEKVSTRH